MTPTVRGSAARIGNGAPRGTQAGEIVALGALLVFYLAVSLRYLDAVPPIYGDEGWESSVGWKLASRGTFGSDMFTGFYGMEQHYYEFLPVHPLLLAASFRLLGLGLWQARLVGVAMGFLVLLLTHALGRRLFGWRVGALAVAFLVLVRVAGTTRFVTAGIPLIDVVRIARYDIVVPVFGLASLHAYLSASRRAGAFGYALAGALAALAGLSHVYGVFWLFALAALALCDHADLRCVGQMALGFAVPWMPYLAFIAAHPHDWLGQTRHHAPRFDLLNPGWYWKNLIEEPRRYGPGLGPPGWGYLARPGFWMTLAALPASVAVLARRGLLAGDAAARAVALPALALAILFALLVDSKLAYYAITIWPLGAIALAWGVGSLWRRAENRALRAALAAMFAAVGIEGATRIAAIDAAGAAATRLERFVTRVREHVPEGARVLGLQEWWMGFCDLDYRSWVLPMLKSSAELWSPPMTFEAALDEVDPQVVLIDSRMRAFLAGDPRGPAVYRWMEEKGYRKVADVSDPTYGPMDVYRRVPLDAERR